MFLKKNIALTEGIYTGKKKYSTMFFMKGRQSYTTMECIYIEKKKLSLKTKRSFIYAYLKHRYFTL